MHEDISRFLKEEFDIDFVHLNDLDGDKLEMLYNQCCEIEIDEAEAHDPISRRGLLAATTADYLFDTYAPSEE